MPTDSTFFDWISSFFKIFQLYALRDNNGVWLVAMTLFWSVAGAIIAVLYRRAKFREYISTDLFDTQLSRIPTYIALLQAKQEEKAIATQRDLERSMKQDDFLHELRTGNKRSIMYRLRRWLGDNVNDQTLVTVYEETKGKNYIGKEVQEAIKVAPILIEEVSEPKLSAWDKVPPTYDDLDIVEISYVANRAELRVLRKFRQYKG